MLNKLRPRSAYDVMAALSLFIVLGGTSYAVASGSIDSREIKNNSIRGKDIRNGTIASGDVRNNSLVPNDFRGGALPAGPQGPAGATGPQGPIGPRGLQGVQGANGDLSTLRTVEGGAVTLDTATPTAVSVPCPAGEFPTGGGYRKGSGGGVIFPQAEGPVNNDAVPGRESWSVSATANTGATTMIPIAVCAKVTTPIG